MTLQKENLAEGKRDIPPPLKSSQPCKNTYSAFVLPCGIEVINTFGL